ncbi:MAG: hypothetical protein KGM91_12700 [Burkholderiales bacterium]|nr:hypothetical protein [Burkholderiales bacterium]
MLHLTRSATRDFAHHRLALAALAAWLLGFTVLALGLVPGRAGPGPGSPWHQSLAAIGSLLLLVPMAFSAFKRSALARRPRLWFGAHALCSSIGFVLVCVHAASGRFWSPPTVLVALLLFLVLQGALARSLLSQRFSEQFGTRHPSFLAQDPLRRRTLAGIIERKRELLARLDRSADEAVFSPNLRHALRHPWLTLRYAQLAGRESDLVGARRAAGAVLRLWRRLHLLAALLFTLGLFAHVALVLFFAGYVAQGRAVYWWHLANWNLGS